MAYSAFDSAKPASSETGTAVPGSANVNDCALWDASLMLGTKSFDFSLTAGTGSTQRPQYVFFKNGTRWLRGTCTWGSTGGEKYNPTQIVWELSTNSGSSYDTIATQTFTWDSNGYPTATSGAGSFGVMVFSLLGHFWRHVDTYTAHVAATGASVHGLGNMSTQAKTAVDIEGGTIDGTPIGGTTASTGVFTRASEQLNTYTPSSGAGVTVDWSKGGSTITNSGTNALTFSNVPSSVLATHFFKVSAFNSCTWPASLPSGNWGTAGKPSIAGAAQGILWTLDGGTTVYGAVTWS